MRSLKQHPSCKRLKNKRNNPPSNEITAKRAWRRFNKKDTRKACYKRQQGLCAYTELSLDSKELGCHLEHIAPRSRFPERTFLSDNLVLSTLADDYSGALAEEQRFAGHFKKNRYEDEWFISPYDTDCEQFFEYCSASGEVHPNNSLSEANKIRAERTISILNLNCDFLINERLKQLSALELEIKNVISGKGQLLDEPIRENIPAEKYSDLKKQTLTKLSEQTLQSIDKKLPEFYTAKYQLLQRYLKQFT